MHMIYKLIQRTQISQYFQSTLKRNLHTKRTSSPPNKLCYLILSGLGLTSYYYLYLVPKWTNRRVFIENLNSDDMEVINKEDLKLHLGSKLCDGNKDTARNQFNFVDKVVKQCAPGVFHILITTTKPVLNPNVEISPFVYGSGFVIREDGWAITNAHVVLNKDSYISCKMSDGTVYSAEVVDIDVNIDVALLKLHTDKELTPLSLEQPGLVDVGEWVVALGSPLSLSNSISVGVVSSINRSARELGLKNYSMSYIQTDALITFGNSGGPLVNLDGKVIGISSLRLTSGISFAIPVEFCVKFLENCKAFKNPLIKQDTNKDDKQMTLYGLTTISITSDLLMDLIQKELIIIPTTIDGGLLIWKVLDGSISKECGLAVGDIITHIDGVPVKYARDLYTTSKANRETVQFVVIKKSTQKEIIVNVPMNKIISSE